MGDCVSARRGATTPVKIRVRDDTQGLAPGMQAGFRLGRFRRQRNQSWLERLVTYPARGSPSGNAKPYLPRSRTKLAVVTTRSCRSPAGMRSYRMTSSFPPGPMG